jgi:hypothetical protein
MAVSILHSERRLAIEGKGSERVRNSMSSEPKVKIDGDRQNRESQKHQTKQK